jgi:hypothetical protein
MHTIAPPDDRWGPLVGAPGRYAPTRPNGKRVPGWEDVNITLLASDMGVSFRYLLAVLCGQRNCTLSLLQQTARTLGLELSVLISRMEKAYNMRLAAAAIAPEKGERRRVRSERRAIQSHQP